MRLAWGSPWNDRSAIATFGKLVVGELLARGHSVEVWRTEVGQASKLAPLDTDATMRNWEDAARPQTANKFDAVLANFGDHYEFHGALIPNFSAMGAIGIFHDWLLANLVYGWAQTMPDPELTLRRLVGSTYPADAWNEGETFISDLRTVAEKRPMLDWFASAAVGGVVHAQHYAAPVERACAGPVKVIPLAFELQNAIEASNTTATGAPTDSDLVVVTVGVLNANKRMDQVIRAIAGDTKLRTRWRYRLIGEIEPAERARLSNIAASLDWDGLEFLGRISNEELERELHRASVLASLRYPALEGGSASLLLSMLSGRPTLVSSHAVYAELPDGLVLSCVPGHESADIARHLTWVMENPASAHALGNRAAMYVRETHSVKRYVDALLPLVDESIAGRPAILAGQSLGRTLGSFALQPNDASIERVGDVLESLTGVQS